MSCGCRRHSPLHRPHHTIQVKHLISPLQLYHYHRRSPLAFTRYNAM